MTLERETPFHLVDVLEFQAIEIQAPKLSAVPLKQDTNGHKHHDLGRMPGRLRR